MDSCSFYLDKHKMNIAHIASSGTAYDNSIFIKVRQFSGVDASHITNASTLVAYDNGSFKADSYLLSNPLASPELTGITSLQLFTADNQYRFSTGNKWILFRDSPSLYTLFNNSFYTLDFVEYSKTHQAQSQTYFERYCDLVDYTDSNCLCIQPADDSKSSDHCLIKWGYDPKTLTPYQYNQLASACSCFIPGCSNLRTDKSASFFNRSCDIVICDQRINITNSNVGSFDPSIACSLNRGTITNTDTTTNTDADTTTNADTTTSGPTTTTNTDTPTTSGPTTNTTSGPTTNTDTPTTSLWKRILAWFGIEFFNEKDADHIFVLLGLCSFMIYVVLR